jgi:coproporphyrinogen III oxidase
METTVETINKEIIVERLKELQDRICSGLEFLDGKAKFQQDLWEREGGGGGRTRLIQNGNLLAKGGVNFSAVHGETPDKILQALALDKADFFATGVSIVLHPKSPMVPIIHMNVRYFEMSNGVCWFGGGIDLTPHYIFEEDAQYFHQTLKKTCDKYDDGYYDHFKKWADDYFYIKHRKETRGIGGIFFDHLKPNEHHSKETLLDFIIDVGNTFVPVYSKIANRTRNLSFGDQELKWQALRRGRYVEFNLVYDKGTKFGLDTDGRAESILMSMPPTANWEYNHTPTPNSPEARTLSLLRKEVDWLNIMG